MLEIHNASATDTTMKRKGGTYTALPPTDWDCSPSHEETDDEEVQPGDENFRVCYDDGTLIVIHDGDSYHGHISNNNGPRLTIREAWCGIIRAGLAITNILPTKAPGAYTLRLRELTDTEKEILHAHIL